MNKRFIDINDDCIDKYFKDIKKHSLITQEEEINLAKRIKKGDSSAVEQLVQANLKFVISIAKNYQNQGVPLNDLINDGNEGLIRAAYKFDHTKGNRFISYAVWWIRQAIIQSLNDNSRTVRLPVNQVNKISQVRKEVKQFELIHNRQPVDGEIVNEEVFESVDYPICVSTNKHVNEDKDEFGDFIIDETFDTPDSLDDEDEILRAKISELLSVLSPRERDIIECYYGLLKEREAMTLEAIGEKYDLTKERIRQIKFKSLRKLRHHVHDLDFKLIKN